MTSPAFALARRGRALRFAFTGLNAAFAAMCFSVSAQVKPAAILQDLKSFREMGSVLYVAAHPDDENTQLITYLARGRGYRTAYLSMTRGDGGQNLLGPQLGPELGVARTQELLAARRLDGGRQFFTRAIDFGFSKDYRETLKIWNKQEVLSDIVRVIREFRPDVMVTRFSTVPGNTHGHHTASAVLALEAFKLAGDPKAFPEQLHDLKPWQPKRILQNGGAFGGTATSAGAPVVRIEVDGTDPVLGETFAEIAGRSRAMHKTQGFGNFGHGGNGPRWENFQLLDGEPATNDIMDGIDLTWNRVQGGSEIAALADAAVANFNSADPAASVPALLKIRAKLADVPNDPVVADKRKQLDRILESCLGLSVKTTIAHSEIVPGEKMQLHYSAIIHSSVPVRWIGAYPLSDFGEKSAATAVIDLVSNQPSSRTAIATLPLNTPLTQPYWLREKPETGMYRVDNPALIGRPENPPVFPIEQVFEVGGQTLVIDDQPVEPTTNDVSGIGGKKLDVIPPVWLNFASEVKLFAPGATHSVDVEVSASRPNIGGQLQLDSPSGWEVKPASQNFKLAKAGDTARFTFTVTAPKEPTVSEISAHATVGNSRFSSKKIEIAYNHIPSQLLQPPAELKTVCLDMETRGHEVGYLPGAGDDIAQSLQEMGYKVKMLGEDDLTADGLRGLDAVVIGIRAFDTRPNLSDRMPALSAFVQNGGNVIVQYNRPGRGRIEKVAPFDLRISQERVTDETAPVTFLAPDHPALNTPNKITSADFDGWIQERGVYFPNQWDEHFTPLLACNDPGEPPKSGALLVAHDGKGYFVYTGLAFFRQLPAGVPGAYRLFANLVSLGK